MSNYSKKALTREEALKLKALGESYDVTPMSIKEAIIAGASSEDGDEPSKEDFLVQALTNDERLDFYRNSNSGSGGSGEITDFFKTINVELYLSDTFTEYIVQESVNDIPLQLGAPSLFSNPIPPQSADGINYILSPMTETLVIRPSEVPKIIECICPIGGGVILRIPGAYKGVTFVEASGSVVMEYSDLGDGFVVANGDCAITIGLSSELDGPDEPPTPQV